MFRLANEPGIRSEGRLRSCSWALLAVAAPLLMACAGSMEYPCKRDAITGSEQCQPVGRDYKGAAAAGGAAAGTWAVFGCTINGCVPPDRCNTKTKQCESPHCKADHDCPAAYHCDMESTLCR